MGDRSRKNIERLASEIGADAERFAELMALFFAGPYRVTHFSAHLLNKCCDLHPHLILPYLDRMIDLLDKPVHDSLKRNIVRTMQFIEIPEAHWDKTANHCFRLLQSKKEAAAIRVFSMTVLVNLCRKIPELKNELSMIIEDQLPYESAAFVSRGRKILATLHHSFGKQHDSRSAGHPL